VGQKLHNLVAQLYQPAPTHTLYHYTSLRGLMGIVEGGAIWASEIKYLNDSEELTHLAEWIRSEIALKRGPSDQEGSSIMSQFQEWSRERLTNGHMLFVTSFTENGNLLSQWRGYCPFGKGVSVGFTTAKISAIARAAEFSLGRCIYTAEDKSSIVTDIVDGVVEEAKRQGPSTKYHPDQCYYHVFKELEPLILRISALIKSRTFEEEGEWRLVSSIHTNYVRAPIKYREGATMLIPYIDLPMRWGEDQIDIERVYIGPSPTPNLSLNSVSKYLSRHVRCFEVATSMSPFRG
jgi:hypothetical protein